MSKDEQLGWQLCDYLFIIIIILFVSSFIMVRWLNLIYNVMLQVVVGCRVRQDHRTLRPQQWHLLVHALYFWYFLLPHSSFSVFLSCWCPCLKAEANKRQFTVSASVNMSAWLLLCLPLMHWLTEHNFEALSPENQVQPTNKSGGGHVDMVMQLQSFSRN